MTVPFVRANNRKNAMIEQTVNKEKRWERTLWTQTNMKDLEEGLDEGIPKEEYNWTEFSDITERSLTWRI